MDFLNYLSNYEKENVTSVKQIVKENKSKLDVVLKEAFYGKFVSKTEAKLLISTGFTDVNKAPKSVDVKYVSENLDAIINKVEKLDEGSIKIIINNNESDAKSKGKAGGGGVPIIVPDIEFEESCSKIKDKKKMKSSDYSTETKKESTDKEVLDETDDDDDDLTGIDKDKKKKKLPKGKLPKDFKAIDEKDEEEELDEKKKEKATTLSYTEFWNKAEAKPDKEDKDGKKIVGESVELDEKIKPKDMSQEEWDAHLEDEKDAKKEDAPETELDEEDDKEESGDEEEKEDDDSEGEDSDEEELDVKWSDIEDHLASIDDKLDTLVGDKEGEDGDAEYGDVEPGDVEADLEADAEEIVVDDVELEEEDGEEKEIELELGDDEIELKVGDKEVEISLDDEEEEEELDEGKIKKIKDDEFGGYKYKISHEFESMEDLINLMDDEEIKNLLYSIDSGDSVESKNGENAFAGADIFDFLPENIDESDVAKHGSEYINYLMGDE